MRTVRAAGHRSRAATVGLGYEGRDEVLCYLGSVVTIEECEANVSPNDLGDTFERMVALGRTPKL